MSTINSKLKIVYKLIQDVILREYIIKVIRTNSFIPTDNATDNTNPNTNTNKNLNVDLDIKLLLFIYSRVNEGLAKIIMKKILAELDIIIPRTLIINRPNIEDKKSFGHRNDYINKFRSSANNSDEKDNSSKPDIQESADGTHITMGGADVVGEGGGL